MDKKVKNGGKKMRKILLILLMGMVLVTSVIATTMSLRATDGTLNYIGNNVDISYTKAKFNALIDKQGELQIIAKDSNGKRIVLNIKTTHKNTIIESDTRYYSDNTGKGIYFLIGEGIKKVNYETLRYDYNKVTGKLNIAGESSANPESNFRLTGMDVKINKYHKGKASPYTP